VTPLAPGTGCLRGAAECNFDGNTCTVEPCCETSSACLARLAPEQRSSLDRLCSTTEFLGHGRTITSRTGVRLFCPAGSGPLNCDDGNPCTEDRCDPVSGCQRTARPDVNLGVQDEGCTRRWCISGQVSFRRNYDEATVTCGRGLEGSCAQSTCVGLAFPAPGAVPLIQGTRFVCHRPSGDEMEGRCSDGIFCNGREWCDPSFVSNRPGFTPRMRNCLPSVPVNCDDRMTCTNDSCDEANRRCVNTPISPGACDPF
jgi:hypothetical protein